MHSTLPLTSTSIDDMDAPDPPEVDIDSIETGEDAFEAPDPPEEILLSLPPLTLSAKSHHELLETANNHIIREGYALVTRDAKSTKRKEPKIINRAIFACDRHSLTRNTHGVIEDTRIQKERTFKRCDCRMHLKAKRDDTIEMWTMEVGYLSHNYEPSTKASIHAKHKP